jgi:hypothetical protein
VLKAELEPALDLSGEGIQLLPSAIFATEADAVPPGNHCHISRILKAGATDGGGPLLSGSTCPVFPLLSTGIVRLQPFQHHRLGPGSPRLMVSPNREHHLAATLDRESNDLRICAFTGHLPSSKSTYAPARADALIA